MTDLIVCKFGGGSITSLEDVQRIGRITADDPRRRNIVVSAPKDVTDMLINLAGSKDPALVNQIIGRYDALCPGTDLSWLGDLINKRLSQSLEEKAYLDSVKAIGEEGSARIVAQVNGWEYVPANELFRMRGEFGNAQILPESGDMVRSRLSGKGIFTIPGFIGVNAKGEIMTLKRNGSDQTGSEVAANLGALVYENFTDAEAIFAADPRIVKNPRKIDEITVLEFADLSYSGFKIFQRDAVNAVRRAGIPVHVRGTSSYPAEGTWIVIDRISDPERPIAGVAYRDGFCSFDIELSGLNSMVGAGMRLLNVFAEADVPVEFFPGGIDDLSFVVRQEYLSGPNAVGDIIKQLHSVLGDESSVEFQENLGAAVIAGKGLRGKKGVSAEVELALFKAGINLRFKTQGTKERCMVYGIDMFGGHEAVNVIYDNFLK